MPFIEGRSIRSNMYKYRIIPNQRYQFMMYTLGNTCEGVNIVSCLLLVKVLLIIYCQRKRVIIYYLYIKKKHTAISLLLNVYSDIQ